MQWQAFGKVFGLQNGNRPDSVIAERPMKLLGQVRADIGVKDW